VADFSTGSILQHGDPCAVEVPVIVIIQSTVDPLCKDLATFMEDSRYHDVEDYKEERKRYQLAKEAHSF
jgi:hypothetical protein